MTNASRYLSIPKIWERGARNRALREAKGKWVALLDSDDWYAPERLERLLQVAYTENADMVADDLYYIQDGEKSPWTTLLSESGESIDKIMQIDAVFFAETDIYGQQGLHLGLTKPLIKRAFLLQNNIEYYEDIKMGQDFWLYLKCLVHGANFTLVPEPYYFYRSRPGSLVTKSKLERLNQFYRDTQNFIQQVAIQENIQLLSSLENRLKIFEKARAYYCVVDPLQQGEILAAAMAMVRNPYFFVHFSQQIPVILSRRLRYSISIVNR